jgi:hypothetical protein
MKVHEKAIEYISAALLVIVGISGASVSILDFIGTDFENGPWRLLKGPLPVMLLTVGILALALGLERFARFQHINRQLDMIEHLATETPERVIRSLDGVDVRNFVNSKEMYDFITKRMKEAERSIDDMTLGPNLPESTQADQEAFDRYFKTISEVCLRKQILYREVISFPPHKHFDRARGILGKKLYGYNLRYYILSQKENLPPIISFILIDSKEVIIAYHNTPYLSNKQERKLAIKHPAIVGVFQGYYEALWAGATKLKEGDEIEWAKLDEVQKSFGQAPTI